MSTSIKTRTRRVVVLTKSIKTNSSLWFEWLFVSVLVMHLLSKYRKLQNPPHDQRLIQLSVLIHLHAETE